MAVDYIWKVHSLEVVPNMGAPLTTSNLTISQFTNVSMPVQANVTREISAGDIFATSGRIAFTSVDVQLTSLMARAMLASVGVGGACIDSSTGNTYYLYVARYECNGPSAGAVHRRYKIDKGLFFLNSANCDHQGDLTVQSTIRAVYDGTNAPVTLQEAIALPDSDQLAQALVGGKDGRWTIHDGTKTTTNGNAVNRKRSVNIDFGVNSSTQGADSDTFDSFAAIDSVLPVVTVEGVDPRWFDDIGLTINGAAVTHANTQIGFRKRDGAGGFVPDASTEHIKVTANGPAYYDQLLSGSGVDAATMSFRIEAIEDGSGNAPLVITHGVAL